MDDDTGSDVLLACEVFVKSICLSASLSHLAAGIAIS